jgi:hypothetical protein
MEKTKFLSARDVLFNVHYVLHRYVHGDKLKWTLCAIVHPSYNNKNGIPGEWRHGSSVDVNVSRALVGKDT